MTNHGHFGLPSIRLAAIGFGALLLHLLLPYGYLEFRGPAAPDGEFLSRGEVIELRDLAPAEMVSTNASPDVVLAGLIIAAAGGILLATLGFQPLQVGAARWIGYGGAMLAAIGAAMAWMASMYSVGTGFAALLGSIFPSEFRAYFWAIGPVVTAVAAGWMTWDAFQVGRAVVATRDGLRDEVDGSFRRAAWGLILMGVVLLVPWSMGILPDGVSDELGREIPGEGKAAFWFSAEDVQSITPAESSWRFRYAADGDFGLLSAVIHVFLALCWSLVAAAWLHAGLATTASVGGPLVLARGSQYTSLPIALLMGAAGVMYVLAWVFFRPNPDATATFLPGFWPLLVLGPFLMLARELLPHAQGLLRPTETPG